jgi:phosphoglycerate dehydrogenase-like enzyme
MISDLLVGRGASVDEAALVARTAWGVLAYAIGVWRVTPGTPLHRHVTRGFALLSGLVNG